MAHNVEFIDITIASGTVSAALDIGDSKSIVGLITPSGIASTAAAFQVSPTVAGTFVALKDGASDFTMIVAASKHSLIDPVKTHSARFVKLVMGTSETAKTFKLAVRSIYG